MGNRRTAALCNTADYLGILMQTYRLAHCAASLEPAVNKREIRLMHSFMKLKNRIFVLGYQHQTRGVAVKAVMGAENILRAVFLRVGGDENREGVVLVLLDGVHRHERRLVDRYQIPVLVANV